MIPTEIFAEWQKLCDEYSEVRNDHLKAFLKVNQKFTAIGQGQPNINPTENELSELEETRYSLESVSRRMSKFVRKHT